MTEESPQAPAMPAAPAAPADTGGRPSLQNTPTPDQGTPPVTPPTAPKEGDGSFTLPDAYKEKGWAGKVKSQDDLYKLIDNQDALIGKKNEVPDFAKATPEEIEKYYARTRPADVKAYDFGEMPKEIAEPVADIFFKKGVPPHVAKEIAAEYNAVEAKLLETAMSEDGFKAAMKKSFGDDYNPVIKTVVAQHKAHLSADDQKLMDALPNDQLALVYRLTSAMAKAYGATDSSTAHVNGRAAPPAVDINAVRGDLRAKIAEIDKRPHEASERQALIDQLQKTYQ